MNKKAKVITLLGMGFCLGFAAVISKYTSSRTQRDPAAFGEIIYDIHILSADDLKANLANRLEIEATTSGIKTIKFNGFSSSICKSVSEIELKFAAEGVSVGGDSTLLLISIPCRADQADASQITPIKFSVNLLQQERPQAAAFHYLNDTATVTLSNPPDAWPKQWVLKQVDFKGASESHTYVRFERTQESASTEPLVVLEF